MRRWANLFNLISYNRAPFNRLQSIETLLTVTFDTSTDVLSQIIIEFPVSIVFDTSTELQSQQFTREMSIVTEAIDTATELLASMIREMVMSASINTSTELVVNVAYTHVDEISFTGELKPGDRLVIDTRTLTVTLNGENALHLINGDFFDLVLGVNKITYTDNSSVRDVLMRVTHRDKFV